MASSSESSPVYRLGLHALHASWSQRSSTRSVLCCANVQQTSLIFCWIFPAAEGATCPAKYSEPNAVTLYAVTLLSLLAGALTLIGTLLSQMPDKTAAEPVTMN